MSQLVRKRLGLWGAYFGILALYVILRHLALGGYLACSGRRADGGPALPGATERTIARLHGIGIYTIGQLAGADGSQLASVGGLVTATLAGCTRYKYRAPPRDPAGQAAAPQAPSGPAQPAVAVATS